MLHLGTRPSDLKRFLQGDFDSSKAISSAKKVLPPFGGMYGMLSNEFVHLGKLYSEPQLYRPYEARKDEGLDTALQVPKNKRLAVLRDCGTHFPRNRQEAAVLEESDSCVRRPSDVCL